jgi:hypothetical protein
VESEYASKNVRKITQILINKKVKKSTATRHGGAWGERRYNSYSFLTLALDGR